MDFRRYFSTLSIYFLFWLAYTGSLDKQELLTGIILSTLLSFFTYKSFSQKSSDNNIFVRVFNLLRYIPVFIIEMIKANIDVARRVINPNLPINPGIVKISTELKSDYAKLFLANSITLTPGTLTIDVIDDFLYIHWIDLKSDQSELQKKLISGKFTGILKGVF
ncbi:MAG: Na+/H+ antiporter subunit E [Halanaerobiales bacterium]|nr:Na+/H+ antiporter subunit E [Halanaerobiales bacterium]